LGPSLTAKGRQQLTGGPNCKSEYPHLYFFTLNTACYSPCVTTCTSQNNQGGLGLLYQSTKKPILVALILLKHLSNALMPIISFVCSLHWRERG